VTQGGKGRNGPLDPTSAAGRQTDALVAQALRAQIAVASCGRRNSGCRGAPKRASARFATAANLQDPVSKKPSKPPRPGPIIQSRVERPEGPGVAYLDMTDQDWACARLYLDHPVTDPSGPPRPPVRIPEQAAHDSGMMPPTHSEIIPPTVPR